MKSSIMEKISIIVTIYNVEAYLNRCVKSLLQQRYKNIEIILVDDCSTDGSDDIAKFYAKKYPNLCKYVQRKNNGGASASRNTGISVSTGKWLAFVDSDDWVTEEYISAMYEVAVEDGADIVMSSRYQYYPDTKKIVEVSPLGKLTTESEYKMKVAICYPSATARLFKKSLFIDNAITFPEDICRSEEIAAIVPILTMTKKISILRKPMYYYFQRKASLSGDNHKNIDVGFYPKAIIRMIKLSKKGFQKELEYRAISELMYGMVMIMIRSEKEKSDISKHINWFNSIFPGWRNNPYIKYLSIEKRIFIYFANKKRFLVLKCLIKMWDLKQALLP